MSEDFIPDSQFKPDQEKPTPSASNAPDFVPDEHFKSDEETYGSPSQTLKAGVEGLERGLTFGLSDIARTKLENYLPESMQTKPEEIKARMEENPIASGVGNVLGGAVVLGATGGVGGALPEGAGLAARLGASAAEGSLFGAGNAVTDYALGDPELNAQKIASEVGFGALLGGGLGLLGEGLKSSIPLFKSQSEKLASIFKQAPDIAETQARDLGENLENAVHDAPPRPGVKETSIKEMQDRVDNAKYTGESTELPQKAELLKAVNNVELMNPVHPLQIESAGDQDIRDFYNIEKETGTPKGKTLRDYEALQKNELVNNTNNEIQKLAPKAELQFDAVKGGNRSSEIFTNQYQAEKNALSPIFEEFKKTPLKFNNSASVDAISKMSEAVPGVSKMFDASEGALTIKPYKTAWGIDKATYNAVKEATESLLENPNDFESIQNIRKGLDQHVDVLAKGQAPTEIRALKKALMDFMQDTVQQSAPSMEVREAFKRYAINEQEREAIEKIFGASVGSPEFGAVSKIKPEVINDRIFANTANVNAAKKILEPKEFNEILGNWLTENKARITDKGAFSSNKWNTFIKNNQDALNAAFSDNPGALQRLKDYTTIMRILPDAPSINPSGTAKTLLGALKNIHGTGDLVSTLAGFAKEKTVGKLQEEVALKNLNAKLAGQEAKATVLNSIGEIIQKQTDKIDSATKSIFHDVGKAAILKTPPPVDFHKAVKKLDEFSQNPSNAMDNLAYNTEHLHYAAPNITQSIHSSVVRAAQFLSSKVPRPVNQLALSQDWEPSQQQKDKFARYYTAVNNPISVLKEVKDGSLNNESLEAMQTVHPDLLKEMRTKVMENINPKTAKNLTIAKKISLSKFMGEPLDNSLMPGVILSNQMAFNAIAQQNQQQQANFSKSQEAKSKHSSMYATSTAKRNTEET